MPARALELVVPVLLRQGAASGIIARVPDC
jgi:hypothetical protein